MVLRVLAIGGGIIAVGAILVLAAYRSFDSDRKSSRRSIPLILAALTFVVLCCLGLLVLSMRG